MMKLFVAVLATLAFTQVSAETAKTAAVGYKSSKIEIPDGKIGTFTIDVSDYGSYCNTLVGKSCFLEIEYVKYPAGEQSVSATTNVAGDKIVNLVSMGVSTETTTKFCMELGTTGTWPTTATITVSGVCGGITAGCISTTDAALSGVRIVQGDNTNLVGDGACPTTGMFYIPFKMDTMGSNTAKFKQDALTANFAFPSMEVTVPAGGDKLFLMLDITKTLANKYGVQFHITQNGTCGSYIGAPSPDNCMDPSTNPELSPFYKVYPTTASMQRGNFKTPFISLVAGTYGVTPYVLATTDDSVGNNNIEFRFCAALGKECDSAFAAAPSMLFGAILAAVVAAFQRF